MHISNILKENELKELSVVKDFLTTAADGKSYTVRFYSLEMILAVGFRVRCGSRLHRQRERQDRGGRDRLDSVEQVALPLEIQPHRRRRRHDRSPQP